MDAPTRSSRARNPAAAGSLVVGLAALAAVPGGVGVARYSERVDLVLAVGAAIGAAAILGIVAIALSRRGQWRIQRTLGRSRGARAARTGRFLGSVGVCVALTGGLALGFFGLLELFAR